MLSGPRPIGAPFRASWRPGGVFVGNELVGWAGLSRDSWSTVTSPGGGHTFLRRRDEPPRGRLLADLAASFQAAVVDVLSTKAAQATETFDVTAVLLSGGVTANKTLRATTVERVSIPVYYPPIFLCTDNAAMVGACAHQHFVAGDVGTPAGTGLDLDVVTGLQLG